MPLSSLARPTTSSLLALSAFAACAVLSPSDSAMGGAPGRQVLIEVEMVTTTSDFQGLSRGSPALLKLEFDKDLASCSTVPTTRFCNVPGSARLTSNGTEIFSGEDLRFSFGDVPAPGGDYLNLDVANLEAGLALGLFLGDPSRRAFSSVPDIDILCEPIDLRRFPFREAILVNQGDADIDAAFEIRKLTVNGRSTEPGTGGPEPGAGPDKSEAGADLASAAGAILAALGPAAGEGSKLVQQVEKLVASLEKKRPKAVEKCKISTLLDLSEKIGKKVPSELHEAIAGPAEGFASAGRSYVQAVADNLRSFLSGSGGGAAGGFEAQVPKLLAKLDQVDAILASLLEANPLEAGFGKSLKKAASLAEATDKATRKAAAKAR